MTRPKKILLVSSHRLSPEQREALYKRFGRNCIIEMDSSIIGKSRLIIQKYTEGGYDDLIVNSAIFVLEDLLKKGIQPIISKMQRNREYPWKRFLGFKRLVAIERVQEVVKPDYSIEKRKVLWWSDFAAIDLEVKELQRLFGNIHIINLPSTYSVEYIAEYIEREGIFKLVVKTQSRWTLLHLKNAGVSYISPYITKKNTDGKNHQKSENGNYYRFKGYFYTHRTLIEEDI